MGTTHSVVVIETEPIVRSVVAKMFESAAVFCVRETDCPIKGSEMCAAQETHLIVTEFRLRMAGDQAMRLLRHACPRARILIIAGTPGEENVQRWAQEEGFDLLAKPFTVDQLIEKSFALLQTR